MQKDDKGCKSCRSRQERSNEYLPVVLFFAKNRRRYIREQAVQSLEVIEYIGSFASLFLLQNNFPWIVYDSICTR